MLYYEIIYWKFRLFNAPYLTYINKKDTTVQLNMLSIFKQKGVNL